jgi:putative hemolysin
VQIGITLVGIFLGVYSGENITQDVKIFINQFEILQPFSHSIATFIVVIFITYLSIVLGELLPKRLAMVFPERTIIMFSRPMNLLSKITLPFVWLLTFSNNFLLRLLGISSIKDNTHSEEEIKSIINESTQVGEIQEIEQNIVERVFELGDTKVNSLFTHRSNIVFFTISDTWEDVKQKINEEKHSAYPLSSGTSLEDMIGLVLIKDLFAAELSGNFDLKLIAREPLFFNENAFAYQVLDTFKKEGLHYGMVVDEYGTIIGMITMDDMLDALVGEVTENEQDEFEILQRDTNSWLVDGQYSMKEFLKFFDIQIDADTQNTYATVAGLLIHISNKLPETGEKITIENYEIEIIDKDGQRIDKVMVTRK